MIVKTQQWNFNQTQNLLHYTGEDIKTQLPRNNRNVEKEETSFSINQSAMPQSKTNRSELSESYYPFRSNWPHFIPINLSLGTLGFIQN